MDRSYGRGVILVGLRVGFMGAAHGWPCMASRLCGRCSGFCGSDPLIAMRTLIGRRSMVNARVRDQWIAPTKNEPRTRYTAKITFRSQERSIDRETPACIADPA
jgi:hypothetical protein